MIPSWRERAACVGADPTIFHRLSKSDLGLEDMTTAQVKDRERSNFKKALEICATCPVTAECGAEGDRPVIDGDSSLIEGIAFSVWGGKTPRKWTGEKQGRPRKTVDDVCSNGHVGMYRMPASGRIYCRGCRNANKGKLGGVEVQPRKKFRTMEEKHQDGTYDHAIESVTWGGKQVCKVCKRGYESSKRSRTRDGKGPVDYDARHRQLKGHEPDWKASPSGHNRCMICERARDAARKDTRFNRKRVV